MKTQDQPPAFEVIAVGDLVRSHDFPDRIDDDTRALCYVEGVVEEIGRFDFPDCDRYKIRATKRVWAGVETDLISDHFYPPVNGTPTTMGRVTNGVRKVTAGQ